MKRSYRKVMGCSAMVAMLVVAVAAFAGQEPYVAVVGDDTSIPTFYISPKHFQFTHPNTHPAYEKEHFKASQPVLQDEKCVLDPNAYETNPNARVREGNAGYWEWHIVLPKKPQGNLNVVIQCGILKPQEMDVLECAGETGERQGPGRCNRRFDEPGHNPVHSSALPRLTVKASPGPFSSPGFKKPFNLTAYRNPSNYHFREQHNGRLKNSSSMQVLNGSSGARFVLKACMDKTIFVKIPVTGQLNALGQVEYDLEAGDRVWVRMDIPRGHTMDVYCHAQSVRIQGLGNPITLLP